MKAHVIHDDLATVLDGVEIFAPDRYTILSRPREITDEEPCASPTGTEQPKLVSALAEDLYARLYTRSSQLAARPVPDILARRDHIAKLSAANSGKGTWEPGWRFLKIDSNGQAIVIKDNIAFWAPTTAVRRTESQSDPGESCRVWVGKELRQTFACYYVALGDAEEDAEEPNGPFVPMSRYYWHVTASAAPQFLATATTLLNAAQIPFRIKLLVDPHAYQRADAGVLFLRSRDNSAVSSIIAAIHSAVATGLRPSTPMFTKQLAHGLGYAKSPSGSMSFGQQTCLFVAQALWQSFLRGEVDRDARLSTLAERFVVEGIDPLRPYLGTGNDADDVVLPVHTAAPGSPDVVAMPSGLGAKIVYAKPTAMTLMEVASRIGDDLCRSAYWDDSARLCNWIGRSGSEATTPGGPIKPAAAALGPDIYSGSAGVALFLARLHAVTGDSDLARTALGAIRRSIRQLDRTPSTPSDTEQTKQYSFFRGDLGVAYAAWHVGFLTGQSELDLEASSILDRAMANIQSTHQHALDVMSGNAGTIPTLLQMARKPGLERCFDYALTLGEALCAASTIQGDVYSWDPEVASGPETADVPLAGLANGASGIGLALFELHAATGRRDFLDAARGAFAYEDTLFDAEQKNWPDLRRRGRSPLDKSPLRFVLAWCQGAPGIALARLRASELDPDRQETYRAMARIAIESTLAAIDKKLEVPSADATLCHGLSGLMEVLFIAGRTLGDSAYLNRAREVGHALIDRHTTAGDWPSGVRCGGPNPSLMLGTAGIGYSFLRLHAPEEVPPVLLIHP